MSTNSQKGAFSADDWMSQTAAARLRKVTKQAISKLIRRGRLRSMEIGGHVLVLREDVQNFQPNAPGRPARRKRG